MCASVCAVSGGRFHTPGYVQRVKEMSAVREPYIHTV